MAEPKYTTTEFAALIKSKYPQYRDIDDEKLTSSILQKYPVYKDIIRPPSPGLLENLGEALPNARQAASAAAEVISRPFGKFQETVTPPVVKIATTPIPFATQVSKKIRSGREEIALRVTDAATRRGFPPKVAGLAGTLAATPSMLGEVMFPIPETVGEAGALGLSVAALGAAPRVFPMLRQPVSQVPNTIRMRLGLPVVPEVVSGIPPGTIPTTVTRRPPEPRPPQAALSAPPKRQGLLYEPPIRGEGFELVGPQARQIFEPRLGEMRLQVPPATPLRAIRARLGLEEPLQAVGRPPGAAGAAPRLPGEPKLTRKLTKTLLADPTTIESQANVETLVRLVRAGKVTDGQLRVFTNRLGRELDRRTRVLGPDAPETAAAREALEALGIKRRGPETPPQAPPQPAPAPAAAPRAVAAADLEAQAGRKLHEMTLAEFKAKFPQVDPEVHKEAVRQAVRKFKQVPEEVAKDYLDVMDEHQDELLQKAISEFEAQHSPTPILDLTRQLGVDREAAERFGYSGELENALGRQVFKAKGGKSVGQLAEEAYSQGLIPEKDNNVFLQALDHELRVGRALFPEMAPGMIDQPAFGQAGAVRLGGAEREPIEQVISEYRTKIKSGAGVEPGMSWKEVFDKLYTEIVDRFDPILNLRKFAKDLPQTQDPRYLVKRYLGAQGIAESKLIWKTTLLDKQGNLDVTGEGLLPVLRDAGARYQDLSTYLTAQRDLELAGREIYGLNPEKAAEVLRLLELKHGKPLDDLAVRVRDWQKRAILDPLLDVGAINQDLYNRVVASNKFHVPYHRVVEELDANGAVGRGSNLFSMGQPLKRIKGSEKPIQEPFEAMLSRVYAVTRFVEAVRVNQSIVGLRDLSPDLKNVIFEVGEGRRLEMRPAEEAEGVLRSVFPPGKDVVLVPVKGEPRHFKVPHDVYEAMQGMKATDVSLLVRILGLPAQVLRAGVTLDPQFALMRNPVRDQLSAFILAKYGYFPGVDFARGLFNVIGRSNLYYEWMAAGGDNATMVALDRAAANIRIRKLRGTRELDAVPSPLGLLQLLSMTTEESTRVGVFARARRSGASSLEAAYESRESTVDFGVHGANPVARALNMMTAFQNPNVQSLFRFGRAFKENPGTTSLRVGYGLVLPSILLWVANKDDKEYAELPEWKRNINWYVRRGGRLITIPKPFEFGVVFASGTERVLDWMYKKDPKAIEGWLRQVREVFTPPVLPTTAAVPAEIAANYNFFTGRPIVPKSKQGLLPGYQAGDYTSEASKAIGRRLGISPAKIDYGLRGYLGTLGKHGLQAADVALSAAGKVPVPPPAGPPFKDILYERPPIGSESESVNRFYRIIERLEQEYATKAVELGIPPGYKFPVSPLLQMFRDRSEEMRKFRTINETIRRNPKMLPEKKKEFIDRNNAAITKIAAGVVPIAEKQGY